SGVQLRRRCVAGPRNARSKIMRGPAADSATAVAEYLAKSQATRATERLNAVEDISRRCRQTERGSFNRGTADGAVVTPEPERQATGGTSSTLRGTAAILGPRVSDQSSPGGGPKAQDGASRVHEPNYPGAAEFLDAVS